MGFGFDSRGKRLTFFILFFLTLLVFTCPVLGCNGYHGLACITGAIGFGGLIISMIICGDRY